MRTPCACVCVLIVDVIANVNNSAHQVKYKALARSISFQSNYTHWKDKVFSNTHNTYSPYSHLYGWLVRGNVQFYHASRSEFTVKLTFLLFQLITSRKIGVVISLRSQWKQTMHNSTTHTHIIYPLTTTVVSFLFANQLKRKISKEISRSRPFVQQQQQLKKKKLFDTQRNCKEIHNKNKFHVYKNVAILFSTGWRQPRKKTPN